MVQKFVTMFAAVFPRVFFLTLAATLLLASCSPLSPGALSSGALPEIQAESVQSAGMGDPNPADVPPRPGFTPRPNYQPGELVSYTAQTGDTLPALATRFNTTVGEILEANTFIPQSATTMPPGMPMQIPIYYLPLWGSQYQILPDSLFINGPVQVGFDSEAFVSTQPGWLNGYTEFAAGATRSGANVVNVIAQNYSISPRLLLALLEYQSGALSQPADTTDLNFPLGYQNRRNRGLYLQLAWAANSLNNGYYNWRRGAVVEFTHTNGRSERPDPWQNAGTVALQYFFLQLNDQADFNSAVSADGFAAVYRSLFGDPWENVEPHLPGSLEQITMLLPFERGTAWTYTGGPHTAWGSGQPLAAIDFAPPSVVGGCQESLEWVTAVAPGVVTRSEEGVVELDLDGDGDPRTGWTMFYLHVGTEGRAPWGPSWKPATRSGTPPVKAATRPARMFILPASTTASGCWPKAPWPSTWKAGSPTTVPCLTRARSNASLR